MHSNFSRDGRSSGSTTSGGGAAAGRARVFSLPLSLKPTMPLFFLCALRQQGSPDYSEYGYEPEFELQGEEGGFNADEETLAKWRLEKLLVNDKWQFGKYGSQNVGSWVGE